ncbi:ABC transporter substrate-binding protein [Brevibacterium renqingii]|uniref:ABC transporter substrate-binding protein n=1 Tax=Brevibacterium renqingii TaxID=2776916 RepID=UPI001ADF66C7|nr:ABC transporter substrate-binding protein [Brevibacterium renqingii]
MKFTLKNNRHRESASRRQGLPMSHPPRAVLAIVAVLALLFSGCASHTALVGSDDDTLIYGTGEVPRVLNPAVQSGLATATSGAQLFASPVLLTKSLEPKPYLAKSWDESDDGKKVTLHLVDSAKFHDGVAITSEDVAFSLDVVKREHPFGANLFGPVTSVDTPDKHTVVINLSRRHPALMTAMSPPFLPVIPKHVYGTGDTVADHPQNSQKVVGSGPYRLRSHSEGKRIVFDKVDDFFMDNSKAPKSVIIEIISDENTLSLALEKGEIDMMTTNTPSVTQRLSRSSDLTVAEQGYEGIGSLGWLGFNVKSKYLSDKKVRQAIAYSIDRDYIINDLHRGKLSAATSPIASGSPYHDDDLPEYDRDLNKAGDLLDDAGYPSSEDGKRFDLQLDYAPTSNEMSTSVAETIKANLKEVGINVRIRSSADAPTWGNRVANYDYDMTLDNVWNWGDPVVGVERTYLCSNIKKGVLWANMSQYCNPKVDELFKNAAAAPDEKTRKELYFDVQEILTDELPILPFETQQFRNIYSDTVVNPPNGPFGIMSPLLNTSMEG